MTHPSELAAGKLARRAAPSKLLLVILAAALLLLSAPAGALATSRSSPDPVDPSFDGSGVSCSTFCVAVDHDGYAVVYSGGSWSKAALIDPSGSLEAVSCAPSTDSDQTSCRAGMT